MSYNFLPYDQDQPFLLPPDLQEWVCVPAYHPVMLLKVLVYGYTIGIRSARKLGRRLKQD